MSDSEFNQTHPRERDVFLDASEIVDEITRSQFLNETCNDDPHLRARVEALLKANQNPSVLTCDAVLKSAINDARELVKSRGLLKDAPSSEAQRANADHGRRIRDYELMECLGQGAMGTVFRARHTLLNTHVALKLLAPRLIDDAAAILRFRREIEAAGKLDHPNIVRAVDAGDADGEIFLVMELIAGVDLASITSRKRFLSIPDVCEIGCQVAAGMQYAHTRGLVHRDLKPSNLILTSDADGQSHVKILDLGLAMIQGSVDEGRLTDDGTLMGTLGFMSPEQAEDICGVDNLADIYSLGATLYRLLTGTVPFDGPGFNTPVKRLNALTTSAAPSIAERKSDLPVELVQIIDSMLSTDASKRPQTMAAVITLLQPFSTQHKLDIVLRQGLQEKQSEYAVNQDRHGFAETAPSLTASTINSLRHGNRSFLSDDHNGNFWSRRSGVCWLAAIIIPAMFALGAIRLSNNGNYIVIETTDPDIVVSVEVLKDGQEVDTLEIGTNAVQHWYGSGKYEVRLAANDKDQFTIRDNRFELTRKGRKVVSISRILKDVNDLPIAALPVNTVTTVTDDISVPGSLRQLLATAKFGDTIKFAPALAGQTIVLSGTPLSLSSSVTIDAENLTSPVIISGNKTSRIFEVADKKELTLRGLRLQHGSDYTPGGGISVNQASLTMVNCVISDCSSPTDGAGIYSVNARLLLENCVVARNRAKQLGGGLANYGGQCVLKNCVFTGNSGGREHGAAILNVNGGWMELIHCTVAGNVDSGVSSHQSSTLILDCCIVADNDRRDYGGPKDVWIQKIDGGGVVARGANLIARYGANTKSGPEPIIADARLGALGDYGGRMPTMPLLRDSAAIDAAVASETTPTTDIRGFVRISDGDGDGSAVPDLGASEFEPQNSDLTATQILTSPDWRWTEPVRIDIPEQNNQPRFSSTFSGDQRQCVFIQQRSLLFSKRETVDSTWSDPIPLLSKPHGSEIYGPFLSQDSLTLFFNWSPEITGDKDLWMMQRDTIDSNWSEPTRLPDELNSTSNDGGPCLSPDGLTIVFDSERPGGEGRTDIWISSRESTESDWNPPLNPGPLVNCANRDCGGTLSPDGNAIIFFSERRVLSLCDLWITTRSDRDGEWQPAVRLSEPVNSLCKECGPELLDGGRTLMFSSTRPTPDSPHGIERLWMSRRVRALRRNRTPEQL